MPDRARVSVVIPVSVGHAASRYCTAKGTMGRPSGTPAAGAVTAENLVVIGYQQRLRRERWAAVRSYLHAYATSPDSRWFMGLITAALLELKDEGWTRG
jgi:hypothetical protein